jgi:hypothetical protein
MSSLTITKKTDRLSILELAAIILNLGLAAGYLVIWLVAYQGDMFWRADFSAFYTAAKIVLSGQGDRLYDLDLQAQVQSDVLEGFVEPGSLAMRYVNPPYLAIAIAPLALFPRQTAFILWTVAQLGLAAWYIHLLLKVIRDWSSNSRWLAAAAGLAIPAMLLNLMLGSFSLLMLVCLLEFYMTMRNKQQFRSGCWLAVSALKPQNVLLLGVFLPGAHRWKALLGAVVATVILILVSVVFLSPQILVDYVQVLVSHASLFNEVTVDPAAMYNLKGSLYLISGGRGASIINAASYASLACAAIFIFGLWWFVYPRSRQNFHLYMALTSLLGLIFSPHLNPQDALLLVFPAVMFCIHLRERKLPASGFAAFASVCPIIFLAAEFGIGSRLPVRIPFIAMLVFLVWMLFTWWQDARSAGDGQPSIEDQEL